MEQKIKEIYTCESILNPFKGEIINLRLPLAYENINLKVCGDKIDVSFLPFSKMAPFVLFKKQKKNKLLAKFHIILPHKCFLDCY